MLTKLDNVFVSPERNLLLNYNPNTNTFLAQNKEGLVLYRVSNDNPEGIQITAVSQPQNQIENLVYCFYKDDGFLLITPDSVDFISFEGTIMRFALPLFYEVQDTIIAATHYQQYLALLYKESFAILDFHRNKVIEHSIQPVTRCTCLIVHYTKSNGKNIYDLSLTFCDGTKVISYVGECMRVVDYGRALQFTHLGSRGVVGSFETNWRLSPMDLFSGEPINLGNLALPRTSVTNEARIQVYDLEMESKVSYSLANHNQPNLITVDKDVLVVSGFYKHVLTILKISPEYTVAHVKDISIGSECRTTGLCFLDQGTLDLLVLKRKCETDNIMLTFPKKTDSKSYSDVTLKLLKLSDIINKSGDLFKKSNFAFKSFPELNYSGMDLKKSLSISNENIHGDNKSKRKKKKKCKESNSIFTPIITEEEVQKTVKQILESYQSLPRNIRSDSELSDETIELLAQCQPRHPFVPIPITSSSSESGSSSKEEGNRTLQAEHGHAEEFKRATSSPLLSFGVRDFEDARIWRKSHENVLDDSTSNAKKSSEMIDPDNLLLPDHMNVYKPMIMEVQEEVRNKIKNNDNVFNDNAVPEKLESIDCKLDKLVKLMEKQNCLLEIIARERLVK